MEADQLTSRYREHVAHLAAAYARTLAAEQVDAVAIHSGSLKPRTVFDDQDWPLRPVPHFQHWLPLAAPDCLLLVQPGARPTLWWRKAKDFWERPAPPETQHWLDSFDIREVPSLDAVGRELPKGRIAFIGEDQKRAAALGLELTMNPPGLCKALEHLRTIKTAYEIDCIAEANRRAAAGHRAVRDAFIDGDRSELELHLLFLQTTAQDDPETPYKNIVALGENAATLHHISYGRRASARTAQSLLVDAGAAFCGYCSDITRTYVKGTGATGDVFSQLIARVEQMQKTLCGQAKIGLPYEKLHERAHQLVAEILSALGIARLSADELVHAGITRLYFPHGLGHSLGLQCHDVGCAELKPRPENPFLRNTSTIARDQVFTIEPGIYFIEMLLEPLRQGPHASAINWNLVDALKTLGGVRIEDDLQVVADGVHNLTRAHLA